mmetsp:Transcript_17836/g.27557  ORF Transcript_17836/g.27557 Transcript_17836/m.27557 type:complete len:246 (-) Transcript_17836:179-916(-)
MPSNFSINIVPASPLDLSGITKVLRHNSVLIPKILASTCIVILDCSSEISIYTPSKSNIGLIGEFPSKISLMTPVPISGSTSNTKSHRPFNVESVDGRVDDGRFDSISSNRSKASRSFSGSVEQSPKSNKCCFSSSTSISLSSFVDNAEEASMIVFTVDGRLHAAKIISSRELNSVCPSHKPSATLIAADATRSLLNGASSAIPNTPGSASDIAATGYRPNTSSTGAPMLPGSRGGLNPIPSSPP